MKPIKYFLFFVTALCVSQWNNFGKEPQRGFGPRIPNNKFDSSFSNNLNKRFSPRFTNQQNGPKFPNNPMFKFFVLCILMENIYNYLIKT